MIAATIRWRNARRRLPAAQRSATSTHIMLVQRRRRDDMIGAATIGPDTERRWD